MARLSGLVKTLAPLMGMLERSVDVIARHAMADGLVAKKGHGKQGAQMGPSDCANLLLAVMKTHIGGNSQDAAAIIRAYRPLVPRSKTSRFASIFGGEGEATDLGTALERVLTSARGPLSRTSFTLSDSSATLAVETEDGGVEFEITFIKAGSALDYNPVPFLDPPLGIRGRRSFQVEPVVLVELSDLLQS